MPAKRIDILDSLRGLAALIVLTHHLMVFNGEVLKQLLPVWITTILFYISDLNVEAVLFFFILSGFCIGLAQKGIDPVTKKSVQTYLSKRFRRILPIYWIALIITIFVGILMRSSFKSLEYSLTNLFGNLLFLQTPSTSKHWFSPYGYNGPLWSLSYEFFFYLFFPVFIIAKQWFRALEKPVVSILVLLMVSIISLIIDYKIFFVPWLTFMFLFVVWYYGFLIYKNYHNNIKLHGLSTIIFVVATLALCLKNLIPSASIYILIKGMFMAAVFDLVIYLNKINRIKAFFKQITAVFNFLFNFIGHGSFALYAIHYPILMLCKHFKSSILEQIIILALTVVICVYLEKWTIKKYSKFTIRFNQ